MDTGIKYYFAQLTGGRFQCAVLGCRTNVYGLCFFIEYIRSHEDALSDMLRCYIQVEMVVESLLSTVILWDGICIVLYVKLLSRIL